MPRLDLTQRQKLAAAAAAVGVLTGIAITTFSADDYSNKTNAALADAGVSRSEGATRVTDLLTEVVEPGEAVTTGVNLPRGARVTDVAPGGLWTVEKQTHEDHEASTWYEVTARNTGPAPVRFVAFVEFSVPVTDGGAP